jgi:DNA-binding Xre family transcriptional regulator
MGISYKPLFKLLVDKNMTKTSLREELGLSSATLAKLRKGEPLSGSSIEKICTFFKCQVQDIVEITWPE